MKSQAEIDKYHKSRRDRLRQFMANSPQQQVRFIRGLGPYRVGYTPTVTAATANDYIDRGYAVAINPNGPVAE